MSEQNTETTAQDTASTGTSAAANTASVMLSGRGGYFGVKAGMTQVYNEEGEMIAVTVIDLAQNKITQVKTNAKEGYNGVQVSLLNRKAKTTTKALAGHFKKSGSANGEGFFYTQEFRMPSDAKMDGLTAGATLDIGFIKEGDYVDVGSISKGKGFQGGVKRYHMAGGHKSHGASVNHRSLGSIGNRADPAKCFKLKKMPGQMGNEKTTILNVKVVRVDKENGILLLNGSVPGSKSSVVSIRKAVKKIAKGK